MKQEQIFVLGPVVAFKLITCMTAIDEIIYCVAATMNTRPKMVYGKPSSYIAFPNTAVTTAIIIENTDLLAKSGSHQRPVFDARGVFRIFASSAAIASRSLSAFWRAFCK